MVSDSIQHLVAPKLPAYAEWRRRWPLWTGRLEAWSSEAWANRIHWSVQKVFLDVERQLRNSLPNHHLVRFLPHEQRFIAPRKPEPVFTDFAAKELPRLLQVRVLAIAALFSPTAERTATIEIPDLSRGGLSHQERRDLTSKLVAVLTDTGDEKRHRTLLWRFTRHHLERSGGLRPSDDEQELAVELARGLGLVTGHRGTTKNTISSAVLKDLREEAREIVMAVKDWEIPDDDLMCLGRLVTEDPQLDIKEGIDPLIWLDLVNSEREERRSTGLNMARRSWLATDARSLAFPFLLGSEIDICIRDDEKCSVIADKLLLNRLPGKIKRSTLASIVSRFE